MPFDIGGLAQGAASSIIGTGMGLLLEKHNDRRQLRQQQLLNDQQEGMARRMSMFNLKNQMDMWEKTGPVGQVEQLKKAGLNPALLYGGGGGGGQTANVDSASGNSSNAPGGGGEVVASMGLQLQNSMLEAQIENIKAQTEKTKVEATKAAGVDTDLARANVDNAKLDGIIKQVTGLDMKNKWEQVTFPNRGVEADMHQSEMDARNAVAKTTWELYTEGKLKEKSIEEIEGIVLGNAKSRAERKNIEKTFELLEENLKGQKLQNVILKLESELQTQTGLDKNSPGLLKILGRLFMGMGGWKTLDAMK